MNTLAPDAVASPAVSVTPARLLDTQLTELLAELGVDLFDSSITDPSFVGALVQRRDGCRVLSMPAGRPAWERDTVARALLADAFGVELGPLPEPYQITEV